MALTQLDNFFAGARDRRCGNEVQIDHGVDDRYRHPPGFEADQVVDLESVLDAIALKEPTICSTASAFPNGSKSRS